MRLYSETVGMGARRTALLHGFLGSGQNLRSLARRLSDTNPDRSYELIDLTGHGRSPHLPKGATLGGVGRDVVETALAEGAYPPFDIIGHSLGGRVALAALLEAPEKVGAVTLVDITPSPIDTTDTGSRLVLDVLLESPRKVESRERMRTHLQGTRLPPSLVEWLLTNLRPCEGGYCWRVDPESLDEAFTRLNSVDLWAAVERRTHAITCIRGARSRYVPDVDAHRLEANGVRVHTIEGAGHYLHVDALEELVRLISG